MDKSLAFSRRQLLKGALAGAGTLVMFDSFDLLSGATRAWANPVNAVTGDIGDVLHNYVIRMRPKDFLRTASVHNDGIAKGDACWLYHMGTSSKHLLWYSSEKKAYSIRTLMNFEENEFLWNGMWDIDGRSKDEGAVVHVWGDNDEGIDSRFWRFIRQSDGAYHIQNVNSGRYLSLESLDSDRDETKLVQREKPLEWEVELCGIGRDGSADVRSDAWASLSSFPDGATWMSNVHDDVRLCDLSIPGTHDTGTCSTVNDTEPQSSGAKCQQDYLKTQLLTGVRYLDLRLDAGSDPDIVHGSFNTRVKSKIGFQKLSHVMASLKEFLKESPSECVIALLSTDNDHRASVTDALYKYFSEPESVFYQWRDGDAIPRLGDVRGKVVPLLRFEPAGSHAGSYKYGLCLTGWEIHYEDKRGLMLNYDKETSLIAENGRPYHTRVYAQDNYATSADDKWGYVRGAFDDAYKMGTQSAGETPSFSLAINYTSCTRVNPFSAARNINERLYDSDYIVDYERYPFVGIVANNFPDAQLARSIYERNYSKQSSSNPYGLPVSAELTYGDALMAASFVGGKVSGKGYYRLTNGASQLTVANSGKSFEVEYVAVDPAGNETVTGLRGMVEFSVSPRPVEPSFGNLSGQTLDASKVAQAAVPELSNLIEGDDCAAVVEYCADDKGKPGSKIAASGMLSAGAYWVRVVGLEGEDAENYRLADDAATCFTVAASDQPSQTDGSKEPEKSTEMEPETGTELPDTGDGVSWVAAAGVVAASVAAAGVVSSTMMAEDE